MLSISKSLILASGALALAFSAAGCSDCDGDFCAEGSVAALDGAEVPETAKTIVVWSVAQDTPTLGYKYGAGTSTADSFIVSLDDAEPPAEAIGDSGVGVGFMALVADDADISEGTFDASEVTLLGISSRHAVIYKTADAEGLDWSADFEEGYSCGACVKVEGQEFDTFTTADCDETTIEVSESAPALDVCTWM